MYSKDNSQVIIMNVAKNINENIILKFKYKLYEDLQLPGNPTPIPGNHPIFNYPVKREASLTINLLNHL
jgi:hypothetical protein